MITRCCSFRGRLYALDHGGGPEMLMNVTVMVLPRCCDDDDGWRRAFWERWFVAHRRGEKHISGALVVQKSTWLAMFHRGRIVLVGLNLLLLLAAFQPGPKQTHRPKSTM
jgi:hypothetical protein